jgi:dihydroorotate dehydrogenase
MGGRNGRTPPAPAFPRPRDFVLGVSLGKQKETPLAEAAADYVTVMTAVYPYADYLAVNISSPNTPGLRELQGGDYLRHLLTTLMAENRRLAGQHKIGQRPLLVKIAPDLTWAELDEILDSAQGAGVDGIIATNTTTGPRQSDRPPAAGAGWLERTAVTPAQYGRYCPHRPPQFIAHHRRRWYLRRRQRPRKIGRRGQPAPALHRPHLPGAAPARPHSA